jgi:hypothetical protein
MWANELSIQAVNHGAYWVSLVSGMSSPGCFFHRFGFRGSGLVETNETYFQQILKRTCKIKEKVDLQH